MKPFTGCVSCFACKRNATTYGKCAVRDDIHNLLEEVSCADGMVSGSPIYPHDITAQLRGFLERLWLPYHSFEKGEGSIAPRPVHSAMIYTMNITGVQIWKGKYDVQLKTTEKYIASCWDEPHKVALRRMQFPLDCEAVRVVGTEMVRDILANGR